MRYIPIPSSPIAVINPADDSKLADVTTDVIFRAAFNDPRFIQTLGLFSSSDLRSALVSASPGSTVSIRDEEHAILSQVLTKPGPGILSMALMTSPDAVSFFRSVVSAPDKVTT